MAEASNHKLSFIAEGTRNTTPTDPRFQLLSDSRTTLALTKDNLETARLTSDRFPAEPRTGAAIIGGDITADLSSQTYDGFIESALQGSFVNTGSGEDSVVVEIDDVVEAPFIEVGDTYATALGVATIERIDAKAEEMVIAWDTTVPSGIISYEFFGNAAVTIDTEVFEVTSYSDVEESAIAKAGDTRLAFSILREFTDIANENLLLHTGCEVATWSLSAAANGVASSVFTFFGRDTTLSDTEPSGISYAPAIDTDYFDTFSGELKIDDVAVCIVTDYTFTVNNGHAPKYAVGCAGSQDPSVTQSDIDGSITLYFEDTILYRKYIDGVSFALELTLEDPSGNKMIINMPNLVIAPGTQPDVTEDGTIPITINFTAHKDETLGSHISVTRVNPLAV
jgi:hypothetical protein